jgi:DNA polymerase-3 subunit delta
MTKPVFLFYGDEDYLVDEEVRRVKAQFQAKAAGGLDVETVEGRSATVSQIINSVASVPILFGGKMVVVRDLSLLKPSKRSIADDDPNKDDDKTDSDVDLTQLFQTLKGLSSDTCLIFVVYGGVDKRRKFYKLLADIADVREFKPFAEWEQEKLLSWIVSQVKRAGKKIGSHASRLLMEISGSNLRSLSSEIEKLSAYIGERDQIEEQDIEAVASRGSISIFSLITSLRDKDVKSALSALDRLLKDKEEPASIIGLIASQFRMLLEVKSLKDAGLSESEIAARLGANYYYVKKCSEKTHNFSLEKLKQIMELLHTTDIKLKSGLLMPQVALEFLLIEICAPLFKEETSHRLS